MELPEYDVKHAMNTKQTSTRCSALQFGLTEFHQIIVAR
jgi:hypothetical protein